MGKPGAKISWRWTVKERKHNEEVVGLNNDEHFLQIVLCWIQSSEPSVSRLSLSFLLQFSLFKWFTIFASGSSPAFLKVRSYKSWQRWLHWLSRALCDVWTIYSLSGFDWLTADLFQPLQCRLATSCKVETISLHCSIVNNGRTLVLLPASAFEWKLLSNILVEWRTWSFSCFYCSACSAFTFQGFLVSTAAFCCHSGWGEHEQIVTVLRVGESGVPTSRPGILRRDRWWWWCRVSGLSSVCCLSVVFFFFTWVRKLPLKLWNSCP